MIIGLTEGIEEFGISAGDLSWAQQNGASLVEDYYKNLSNR